MSLKSDIMRDVEKAIEELEKEGLLGRLISEAAKNDDRDQVGRSESFDKQAYIQLYPYGLMSGLSLSKPVFLFKDEEDVRHFPVRLSLHQANLLALSLGPSVLSGSFSVVKKLLQVLQVKAQRVLFTGFKEQVLVARLDLYRDKKVLSLETSAEEVLALAMEMHLEFFVDERVLEQAKWLELEKSEIQQELEISLEKQKLGQKYLI